MVLKRLNRYGKAHSWESPLMGEPTHGKGLRKRSFDFVRLVLIEFFGYPPVFQTNVFDFGFSEILGATVRQKPKWLCEITTSANAVRSGSSQKILL